MTAPARPLPPIAGVVTHHCQGGAGAWCKGCRGVWWSFTRGAAVACACACHTAENPPK